MIAGRILLVALGVFGLDQLLKALALTGLASASSLPVIPGIFHLTLVRNTGVAFGWFKGYSLPVAVATTALVLGLIWMALRDARKIPAPVLVIGFGLILGGAVGNLVDRFRLGAVVDFLDFRIWPVFNLADAAITCGAILIALQLAKKP